jgi:hypothetical protein
VEEAEKAQAYLLWRGIGYVHTRSERSLEKSLAAPRTGKPSESLEEFVLIIVSQGLSTKPRDGVLDNDGDHKGPAEDIQEAKRGHDRDPMGQAQDDGGEVLFLCCYFSRRARRHDQPI